MNDRADDATPAERRLRALLAEEGLAVHVGGAPHAEIVQEGRRARRRSRTVLGAGLAVLVAVPAVALAAQGFHDTTVPHSVGQVGSEPASGGQAGPPDAEGAAEGAEDAEQHEEAAPTADGLPRPPSDPERQLLDGITLEEARDHVLGCLDTYHDPATRLPGWEQPELDPADLQILLAWQGHGGENQGPGPFRRVLVASVAGETHAELVCNRSMANPAQGYGMQSRVGPMPPEREGAVGYLTGRARYLTPEGGMEGDWSSELPFRWSLFSDVDPDAVARVTVEYGGETQEALLDGGYFLASGVLQAPPDASPTVLAYDADGEVIFDSRDRPPFD